MRGLEAALGAAIFEQSHGHHVNVIGSVNGSGGYCSGSGCGCPAAAPVCVCGRVPPSPFQRL